MEWTRTTSWHYLILDYKPRLNDFMWDDAMTVYTLRLVFGNLFYIYLEFSEIPPIEYLFLEMCYIYSVSEDIEM